MDQPRRRQALPLLAATLLLAPPARSEEVIPGPDWQDAPDPIASPEALPGGKVRIGAGQYPKSFNYYLDTNVFSNSLFGAMYETLLDMSPLTTEFQPRLASQVTISDDKLAFTVTIDERARWSDGEPIDARDVAFTVEIITDPENLTGPHKVAFERFEEPEILDERTIRFRAKEVHWRNLLSLGSFSILPEHAFKDRDFNKINFEFPVVSGPYRLGEIKEGVYARLERREEWWLRDAARFEGVGNFQTMEFRFYAERETMFEAFKKGEFDLHAVYTSHIWVNQTEGEAFDKNWIVKQAVYNENPPSWQGFAFNLRREPYDDPKVRRALAHLLDRKRLNRELMFNQYELHRSYWEDLYDEEHPNPNPPIEFDPDKARRLLEEAGWEVNPDTGKLEKDGQPFVVNFLTRSSSTDKFLVVYKEALADVGIDLAIERKDWAAWMRDMDAFNFDMTWAAWGGSLWKDPEFLWHSREADREAGQNITGFKSEKVDALIEKQRAIFDVEKRNAILRRIDQLIYERTPYILLWYLDYTRLLYWNKFGMPETVLSKYGDERSAWWYWWLDPDAQAILEHARDNRQPLPPKPPFVRFHEAFDPQR